MAAALGSEVFVEFGRAASRQRLMQRSRKAQKEDTRAIVGAMSCEHKAKLTTTSIFNACLPSCSTGYISHAKQGQKLDIFILTKGREHAKQYEQFHELEEIA